MRWIIGLLVLGAVAAGAIWGGTTWYSARENAGPKYRTVPVKRGTVVATISATGLVEPQELVDVGAQVAGQINSFGKDARGKPVDYNSPVEQDMILAEIDQSLYAADLASAQAQLAQDQAAIVRAQADLQQMQAKLNQAQRDWDRARKLGPGDALSQSAYDTYQANFETAQANVAVDQAAITQARATVDKDMATLNRAKQNIGYCTIRSPVKGVIIARRVNIGQTVVSSLNAPSLFLIAKDLTKMQLWVQVNEADIGSIHPGQPVTFTVDAFPGQAFHGTVARVRLDATMTQNVVTYTVEVDTDNADGKLLPYLTANAQFEVARHNGVWTVPNAALRWGPKPEMVAPDVRAAVEKHTALTLPATLPATTMAADDATPARLWYQDGEFLRPIPVTTGLTDGTVTEVTPQGSATLKEDMPIISGEVVDAAAPTESNPFTPRFGRH